MTATYDPVIDLALQVKGQPTDKTVRMGVVTAVDWNVQPPLIYVDGRAMRSLTNILPPLSPGDTAVWLVNGAAPWVIGRPTAQSGDNGALQTVTYSGTWTAFLSGYDTGHYWLDPDGWVNLQLVAKNGTLLSPICNLPAGYRPKTPQHFSAVCGPAGTGCRVDVNTSGDVAIIRADTGATNAFVGVAIRFQSAGAYQAEQWDWLEHAGAWTPYGAGEPVPAAWGRDDGLWQATGVIAAGANNVGGCPVPFIARQPWRQTFMTPSYGGGAYQVGRIDMEHAQLTPNIGGNVEQCLDHVRWWSKYAEGRWIAPTLGNSWVNYGAPFAPVGYQIDKYGVTHLRGLIKNGTATPGTTLFTLPVGSRPKASLMFPVSAFGSAGRVDVTFGGLVQYQVGGNGYFDLSQVMHLAEQ